MEFALKRSLVAVGLMLVAFSVSPTVAFAKDADAKVDVSRAEFDAMAAQVQALTQALAAETAAREAADTALQNAIGVEESSRIAGDNNEADARAAADTGLQAGIDAEASARIAGDGNEASLRSAADGFLQLQIDDLLESSGSPGVLGVTIREDTETVPGNSFWFLDVSCLEDEVATGGGFRHGDDRDLNLYYSRPSSQRTWSLGYSSYTDTDHTATVYVVCAKLYSDAGTGGTGGSAGAGGAGGAP